MKNVAVLLILSFVLSYAQAQEAQSAQPAELPNTPEKNNSEPIYGFSYPHEISAYLSYNFTESLSSDSVHLSGVGVSLNGSAKMEIEKAFGVGLETVFKEKESSVGFGVGLHYELPRSLNKITYNINGSSVAGTFSTAKVSQFALYGSILKYWDKHYLMAGLNLTRPTITGLPGANVLTVAGFGYFIGTGFKMNENINFEFLYKVSKFDFLATYANLDMYDIREINMAGPVLNLKFIF